MVDLLLHPLVSEKIATEKTLDVSSSLFNTLSLSPVDILLSLLMALALSALMYWTFRVIHNDMRYDAQFNVMLTMLSLITTVLMMLIRTNLALSLGMVGSLSLVRFRTNIKDSRDIGFVFWAMTIGLSSASRAYLLGAFISILLAAGLIFFSKKSIASEGLLLIIRGEHIDLELLEQDISIFTKHHHLKAHNLMDDTFEMVFEIKAGAMEHHRLATLIKGYDGVDSVNILAPSADVTP